MKTINKTKALLLLIFMSLFLNAQAKTITVTDVLNREVTIKKEVKRVIALGTSISFITYLDSSEKIVAVEAIDKMDLDKRTYAYVNKELVKDLPIVAQGGSSIDLNYEAVFNLKPDVIFMITQNKSEADEISKKLNTPVVVVDYGAKQIDFKVINNSLNIVGKILGKEKESTELINYIENLKKEFKTPKLMKKAYIGALAYKGKQGLVSTKGDFMPFILSKTINPVYNIKKSGHTFINKEFLLLKDPEIIFIDSACIDIVEKQFKKNKTFFKNLKAFRNEQVYTLLANNYYYTQLDQMLANSFFIAKTVYPKNYQNLDPVKKANEIFTRLVKRPMYKTLEKGLTGFKKVVIRNNKLILENITKDKL